MSLISAVTARGHMRFMIIEKSSVNTGVFIEFLKRLIEGAGRKIFLIVDRGQAHRAKKAGAFVQTLGGILRLFFLPPYSPDRNPDEAARDFVWNRAGTGRDRRAGRQTELVAMGLPPQGQRPSWRACRTTPPPVPRAAKAWVRLSLAISALISGSPAAMGASSAGRTRKIRFAAPILSVTCNMPSARGTASSRPPRVTCPAAPAASAGGENVSWKRP